MRSKERPGSTRFPSWKEGEKLVQLDHRVRKRDLLGALGPEFLKEILAPILGDRVVSHTPLVNNPQREVRVLLRKMAAQLMNLFSRRSERSRVIFGRVRLRLIE